jgi:hypothetical protein
MSDQYKQHRAIIIRDRDAFLKHVVGPRRDIKPNVKFMIAIMLTHIDGNTGQCAVGAEKLSTEMGCTPRYAEMLLKKVKATGLVDWPKNKGGGTRNTNHFMFLGLPYGGNSVSPTPNTVFGVHNNANPERTAHSTPNKIESNPEQNRVQPRTLCSDVQVSQVNQEDSQGAIAPVCEEKEKGSQKEVRKEAAPQGGIRGRDLPLKANSLSPETVSPRGRSILPIDDPVRKAEMEVNFQNLLRRMNAAEDKSTYSSVKSKFIW